MKRLLLSFGLLSVLAMLPCLAQNHQPVAVDDYAVTTRGYVRIDVLDNDMDPDTDYIRILFFSKKPLYGTAVKLQDSLIEYRAFTHFSGGYDTLYYVIRDNGSPQMIDTAMLVLLVDNPMTLDSVDINNIKAGVNADGYLFCEQSATNYKPIFEVPAGSGIRSMYSGSLWIGGLDINGQLHLAATRYDGNGKDFWAGPVATVYDSAYDLKYNRVWRVTKSEIDYHVNHYWQPGYVAPEAFINWPAHGNVANGEASDLAPFYDFNGDGTYDIYAGDFPRIRGDKAIYFMFNDDRLPHTETNGNKLGIEVHGMLYAFDCPLDSALWNTVFVNYMVYNYSTYQYNQTYFGSFMDVDLGYAWDDYIGCDVQRGSFYVYNGTNRDGTGAPGSYGAYPPAQSMTFLGGPYVDFDGIDNPRFDSFGNLICGNGINGLNFGDSIIDNERFGLTKFIYFNNTGGYWAQTDPDTAADYYGLMCGIWKDGEPMRYWGNAHPNSGGVGPPCSFMFPGETDSCNLGTAGIDPGGTDPWTEAQAGNMPYDRRGLGITGPFTFEPGKYEEFDLAFVFGRNFSDTNAVAAIQVMQQRIDEIRSYFINDSTPCSGGFSGNRNDIKASPQIKLYPNPAGDFISVEYAAGSKAGYMIYDITGRQIMSGSLTDAGKAVIDISKLKNGMYIMSVSDKNNRMNRKFIKR